MAQARHVGPRTASLFACLLLAVGCGGTTSITLGGGGADVVGSSFFFEDPNAGGAATSVRLSGMAFGRLVELFGRDGEGRRVPMGSDFVIDDGLTGDGANYRLERNPVSSQELLIIERDVTTDDGLAEFVALAREAAQALDTIQVRDLESSGVFSMLPRNAALVLAFDDLIDPGTINHSTIQLRTGGPPVTPFEARVFPSAFYGGRAGGSGPFYPTRVIVDLTVSELEAFRSDPPLAVNGVGAPPSFEATAANAQLRIPTRTAAAVGITRVLTNLTGHPLATSANGPVDFAAGTRPVTRAFRTGGQAGVVNDPFNGFLRDNDQPVVVGSTAVELLDAPVRMGASDRFLLPRVRFESEACASPPEPGDILLQGGVIAEVNAPAQSPESGVVRDVEVRLLLFPESWSGPEQWSQSGIGAATYETAFDPGQDLSRGECFVGISPRPTGAPLAPAMGVSTDARFTLRFSEPMDPASLTAFDSLTLTRSPFDPNSTLSTSSYVVGQLVQTASLKEVSFIPGQLLNHREGLAESYYLRLANEDDDFPPRDLAGNPIAAIPEMVLTLDPDERTVLTGGRVSRFASSDEEAPEGPEFGGQVIFDPVRQAIRPRPVVRSQVVIDDNQPIIQQMQAIPGTTGVITPHTPFGSKLQAVWRYADCSFSLLDPLDQNVDVEGLAWAPLGGSVQPDAFGQFEIRLAHSRYAPDEVIDANTAWPRFATSGLRRVFDSNILPSSPAEIPAQVIVHERQQGYSIDPGDLFTTSSGRALQPFPLNRDLPFDERRYFTWRDGNNRARAGHSNGGAPVDPLAYWVALGIDPNGRVPVYTGPEIQSIGLPLLMEFRVVPDSSAIGINGWDFRVAVNSSARPYFRAFSSGGTNQAGAIQLVNPDSEPTAEGGFSPTSTPPGATTPGRDNLMLMGGLDLITRVSHANSIWFSPDIAGQDPAAEFGGRNYGAPTLEPGLDEQPPGTSVTLSYRGATGIDYSNEGMRSTDNDGLGRAPGELADFQVDALTIDVYGDYYNDLDFSAVHSRAFMNPGISFLGGDGHWRSAVEQIRDARFYQLRITFVGSPETGQTAAVSALAMTWSQP